MQVGDILEIAPSIFSFEGVSDPTTAASAAGRSCLAR